MENEVLNDLLAHNNMKIIQRKDMFNFSLDTVLLSHFCSITKNTKSIIDFGTNNAAIPLLLSRRTNAHITGIEIQKDAVDVANKNVEMNNLEDQISIVHCNLKDYIVNDERADLIVCNPPFFKVGEKSILNESEYLQIARHEIEVNLEEIILAASKSMHYHAKFAIVHRPERTIDIINYMQKYGIVPKRLKFVYPKFDRDANTVLIEGIYKGNDGLKVEKPLYAHDENGDYSLEVRRMFGENV